MDLVSWTFGGDVKDPNSPILLDPANRSRSLSFEQIRSQVRRLIAGLQASGIQSGDCVLVNAFNDIEYYVLYLGIIGSGAVFTGVNPSYTVPELVHHFSVTKPKVIIVEPQLYDNTWKAAKVAGLPTEDIFVFERGEVAQPKQNARRWNELLQHGEKDWVKIQNPKTTVAHYASTSGTSGLPKAAMLSHAYHVSQADLRAKEVAKVPHKTIRLTALPPFHVFATPIIPSSIRMGIETYVMSRFDMDSFLSHVEQYQISETYMLPPLLVAMPKCQTATKETLQSLRQIWFGGASLTYKNQLPLYELLSDEAKLQPVWGMTEAGWITAGRWAEKNESDSVGRPLDGYNLAVHDENGDPVTEDGVIGDLVVKCPSAMLGYLDNSEATESAFTPEGWLRTGDIGHLTDGKVFVVDRKKDLIKVRGWQVSPAEVEGVLLQHPDVKDAAVIGISTAAGEVPRAYVVLNEGATPDESNLRAFAQQHLARYKLPFSFVFTRSIPKNPTGKILRRVLREQASTTPQSHMHGRGSKQTNSTAFISQWWSSAPLFGADISGSITTGIMLLGSVVAVASFFVVKNRG